MPSRQFREESWNSLHHSEASGDNVDDGYSDVSMDDESERDSEHSDHEPSAFPTISDVHRALHPLQATADRVGKQVERFAENLDRLSVKKQRDERRDLDHVLPLLNAYKKISTDTVHHLETMHAPERRQQLASRTRRKFRRSSGRSTPGLNGADHDGQSSMITTVEDLKFWEQEEQTWDLVGLMLRVEYPLSDPSSSHKDHKSDFVRPSRDTQIHHYSSEAHVWESFLASDDQAWERHTVIKWLQKSADNLGQDIEQVVEELESGADRGSGLWAHSWLYTKEAIKGQKRLRSWPKALEPESPGLDSSLLNSEKTQALVTQLDPDAITRQNRALEKQDQSYERAIWLACWEMVRRGRDWKYMREWCEQRVENWRATAMHGDPRSTLFHSSSAANWQSRALWRKTCAVAAKEGGIDEYENAVYGALSGYLPSVLKVSRSWDDHLFAHYNSYLLHSFDRYIRINFANRIPNALSDQQSSFNFSIFGGQRVQSGNQIVEKLKHLDATNEEARMPFKMLQGSLIAKTFDDFVYRHGARLARSANAEGKSKILTPMNDKILEGTVTAEFSMANYDLLRLITHIILVYQDLGFSFGEGERRHAMESIIVAYVDYLSKAGKQQLLPLYASRLSPQRSVACLGRQLPSILDRGERQTFMRLMAQEGIDVPAVLSTQLIMIITDTPAPETNSKSYPKLIVLEQKENDALALRQIKSDFIGSDITDDQQDLIHGFEWYLLLDGHWRETVMVGSVIYKHLLRKSCQMFRLKWDKLIIFSCTGSHGLAAARLLSQTVTFTNISLSKTKAILGQPIDISKDQETYNDEVDLMNSNWDAGIRYDQRRRRSPSLRRGNDEREIMLDQASTFIDFENLFTALDALEEWKGLANRSKRYVEAT